MSTITEPEAVLMDVKTGDEVKVRMDAYTGPAGTVHNGRPGRVIAVLSPDAIIVNYLDRRSVFARHPRCKLFVYARPT